METWDLNSNWSDENLLASLAGSDPEASEVAGVATGEGSGPAAEVPDIDLPTVNGTNQQELIPRILAANRTRCVVMKTQGQVNMPWIDDVRTMVQAWYPGEEDGNVVADSVVRCHELFGEAAHHDRPDRTRSRL